MAAGPRPEVEELRRSRARLVHAADADRRRIERDLHAGPQQHLVALAVNLQLAGRLLDTDPRAAKELVEEMRGDVQAALEETTRLAQRIYSPLLEGGGLAVALRSAAASAGVPATVEVAGAVSYPPDVAWTVCLCWLEALECAGDGRRTRISVCADEETLAFELVTEGAHSDARLARLRDRVEALGGRMTIDSDPAGATRVSGSLPVSG